MKWDIKQWIVFFLTFIRGLFICTVLQSQICKAEETPIPQAYRVVDQAGVLAPNQIKNLATELKKASNHVVISILIVPTTNGEDIFAYSMRVFDEWKLGGKGKDNGILIAIATKDRHVRITTGYGTEGTITDAYAKRVIVAMTPALKQGDYFNALLMAVDKIHKKYESDLAPTVVSPLPDPHQDEFGWWMSVLFGGCAMAFLIWIGRVIYTTSKEERTIAQRVAEVERERKLKHEEEKRQLRLRKNWPPKRKTAARTTRPVPPVPAVFRENPSRTQPKPASTRKQDFVTGVAAGVIADEVARSIWSSNRSSDDSSSSSDNSFSSSDSGGSSGGGGARGDY